ncbi:MAG: hypothetical protein JKY19_05365 [Alcanivoracaceae bacterium]|nr:hypothetical protein [Alcanivoracaceae bacterium]
MKKYRQQLPLLPLMLLMIVINVCAAPLPQFSQEKHMGVATCASGVCHGKSVEDSTENVMMTEYRVWLTEDDHARAYKTLMKPASKQIAKKLGLKSAHTAKICLDCHADNVPRNMRGKKFQITDGVGCEACHGGAEKWLSDHKETGATHEKNIKLGLYPSEKPRDRAKLCLSCHLGTKDKFATHRMMGAGHPRLSLELEAFTQNQPAHYKVDADYEKRKGSISSVNMWLTGLFYKADSQLQLLQSKQFRQHGLFPELSFYECHSCHRPMNPSRWPVEAASNNVPPGSIRLDDAVLVILASVLEVLSSEKAATLKSAIKQLHAASLKDKATIMERAKAIQAILNDVSVVVIEKKYMVTQKKILRKKLLADAGTGLFRDYSSAEQVFYAVETLSIDLKDENKYADKLDKLLAAIDEEDKYYPEQFKIIAQLFFQKLSE